MKSPRNLFAILTTCMAAATSTEAQTAPTARTAPAAEDAITLSTFTVSEGSSKGYQSMQTTSGMRTVQELKNVANSISVVNSELIADIGATSLMEVSKYFVSGEASPNPNGFQQTISRGVPSNSGALRNGWYWYSPQDSYAMERIELLRGPNAFLYGESAMGGMTNQVTKRGLFTRDFNRVKVTGGAGGLHVEIPKIILRVVPRPFDDAPAVVIPAGDEQRDAFVFTQFGHDRRSFRLYREEFARTRITEISPSAQIIKKITQTSLLQERRS